MSFNIGLSGLRAATKDLNVTGNNIANAGTVGFKQSRAEFADVYAASVLGTGKNPQGSGVLLSDVSQLFNQGNINYTQNALDLAINGNGFFQVSNNGAISYSRAGYFGTDSQGFIVDNFGYNLQGYGTDANDQVQTGQISNLQIKTVSQEPKPTSRVEQSFNLNSTSNIPANAPFSPADPSTYNSSTSTNVYDTQGNAHTLTQYFVKTGANSWNMNVMLDGGHPHAGAANQAAQANIGAGAQAILNAAVAALPTDSFATNLETEVQDLIDNDGTEEDVLAAIARMGSSTPITLNMNFNSAGKLQPMTGDAEGYFTANPDGTITMNRWTPSLMNDDSPPVAIANGALMSATGIQMDMRNATQFASTFAVNAVAQDGYTTGELAGLEIDDSGMIFARYTNGQSKVQGQIVLADFANVQGLTPVGKTQWVQSLASGEPVRNPAGTGTLGAIQAGALEDSNVELSDQLVNLIVAQRNYQANAKTIETESAITQTIINLR